jgi:hypothetical protein
LSQNEPSPLNFRIDSSNIAMWRTALLYLFVLLICTTCQSDPPVREAQQPSVSPAEDYETNPYQWGFINQKRELVIADQFDEVRAFSEGLALVRKQGYWGYVDHQGVFKIPARLRAAWPFKHGVAKVQHTDGKYGLIAPSGEWVSPPEWDELRPFVEGWASVRQGDRYGMIDTTGQLRIPLAYDGPGQRNGDQLIIRKGGKYGMVNLKNQPILPFSYERLKPFRQGLARARLEGRYGYLNPEGRWQIKPVYPQAGDFVQGLAPALEEERWGLIDSRGQWVVAPTYSQLIAAGSNRWIAAGASGYVLLDEAGQQLPAGPFVELHPFSEELAAFRNGRDRWGYVNPAGEVVVEPEFLLSWPFQNGQARVATRNGMTLIDRSGDLLMPPNPDFLELQEFSEGLAPVQIYRF